MQRGSSSVHIPIFKLLADHLDPFLRAPVLKPDRVLGRWLQSALVISPRQKTSPVGLSVETLDRATETARSATHLSVVRKPYRSTGILGNAMGKATLASAASWSSSSLLLRAASSSREESCGTVTCTLSCAVCMVRAGSNEAAPPCFQRGQSAQSDHLVGHLHEAIRL